MALLYPPCSQSFSNARWRYPISTSARTMTSPSSSAVIRMIPCMAGCAGPTPTCRFWLPLPVPLPSPSMNSRRVVSAIAPLGRRTDQRLAPVDRVVLPERMTDELLVHQQAPQVGMAREAHAEHVPDFALEPVGDRPEVDGGRHHGVVLVDLYFQSQPVVVRERVEVVDDLEARAVRVPGILQIIDRGQVRQHREPERGLVAAPGEDARERLTGDHRRVVAAVVVRLDDAGPEPRRQRGEDRRPVHYRLASRAAPRLSVPIRISGPGWRSCPEAS